MNSKNIQDYVVNTVLEKLQSELDELRNENAKLKNVLIKLRVYCYNNCDYIYTYTCIKCEKRFCINCSPSRNVCIDCLKNEE